MFDPGFWALYGKDVGYAGTYTGKPDSLRFGDVMLESSQPYRYYSSLVPFKDSLQGKIVLITQTTGVTYSGHHLAMLAYAQAIETILRRDYISYPAAWAVIDIILLTIFAGLCIFLLRPAFAITVCILAGPAYYYIASFVFAHTQVYIGISYQLLCLAFSAAAFSFVNLNHRKRQAQESQRHLEEAERQRLKEELRAAHDMQMGLMPTHYPVVEGFEISGVCKPAEEVGGDYFDYIWLNEEKTKFGIAICDVSGKAMKAAMTAVMTSGMIYRELGSNDSPRSILRKLNKPMYMKLDRNMFTAMSLAIMDVPGKIFVFSNAGQMQPLLRRGSAVRSIRVEGARLPLGVQEDVVYDEATIPLLSGDLLLFFTDGIPEAMNEQEELYGFERLERLWDLLNRESPHHKLSKRSARMWRNLPAARNSTMI